MSSSPAAVPADVSIQFMIPFWGDPALLQLLLTSLITQTDPVWTACVVDDASPQGGDARLAMAGLDDPRLTYTRNSHNLGITANFQRCLDLAVADYVVMPGCDDLVLPTYVADLRAALSSAGRVELFQPGVVVIDGDGNEVRPLGDRIKARLRRRFEDGVPLAGDRLAASLLEGNWLYFPACAFRVDSARAVGFDSRWVVAEDLALVLGILQRGGRLMLAGRPAFAYRRHAASVSSVAATTGDRFVEERAFFAEQAMRADMLGWRGAAAAARRHRTSRLHALSLLPRARSAALAWSLLRHAAVPLRPRSGRTSR